MEWAEFVEASLSRLLARLRDYEAFYVEVREFLLKYGFTPDDPLVIEVETSLRQVRGFIETVNARRLEVQPFRPGVDPWRSRGLSATLRPDSEARGITESPKD